MKLGIAASYVKTADIVRKRIPQRGELNELCPALLQHLEILGVVETEGFVSSDTDPDPWSVRGRQKVRGMRGSIEPAGF